MELDAIVGLFSNLAVPVACLVATFYLWNKEREDHKQEQKELTEIFESFHRGSNAAKAQGNGLGLFICKRLMALMGGEVYADIKDGCFEITLVVKLTTGRGKVDISA